MKTKCETCKVHAKILKSKTPACCVWYLENVVCGNKSTKSCPEYKPVKGGKS